MNCPEKDSPENKRPASCQTHLGIGIDTARYGHHVSFLDQQKRSAAKPFHFHESGPGYRKLLEALQRLIHRHPQAQLHIHVDAAGQYAENLLQWLLRQELPATISVGQPARNKAYRKAHYDKRKADPVESLACARFAVVEQPPATPHQGTQFSCLRDAVAQIEASAKVRTALLNQLHNLLARSFPELATIVNDLSARAILKLLLKYPTAQRIAAARRSSLTAIPHLSDELAERLQQAAQESTASNCNPLAEQLIQQKVQAIFDEFDRHAALEKLAQEAVAELPQGAHCRIRSIPGIGPQTEAALLAKIVSIERFATASALIGYFGVFPEEVDVSGVDQQGRPKTGKVCKMSRKGNDMVRRLLYTAAQTAVRWNPPVRALFARLRAAGKDYNTAIGHCMAKLLRQVFAVWKKDCDFDPDFESTGTATETAAGHNQKAVMPQTQVVTATTCSVAETSPPRRPAIHFTRLREQLTIVQVLEELGWSAGSSRGGGRSRRGWCPVHGSDSDQDGNGHRERSLAVDLERNLYCCHRCGSQGNALDLWAAARHLPLLDAAWDLIERLGIDPPLLKKKEEPISVV